MTPTLLLCVSLSGFATSDRVGELRRLADANRVARLAKNWRAEFLSDVEARRQFKLDSIARMRQVHQGFIQFYERLRDTSIDSPEIVLRCQRAIEELHRQLRELDEQERRVQGEPLIAP